MFDGGELWHYWARLVIYAASQVWGGAGFILVSHRGGDVESCLLRAAAAYDPDHAVLLRVTVRHMELAQPGVQPLRLKGPLVTGGSGGNWSRRWVQLSSRTRSGKRRGRPSPPSARLTVIKTAAECSMSPCRTTEIRANQGRIEGIQGGIAD